MKTGATRQWRNAELERHILATACRMAALSGGTLVRIELVRQIAGDDPDNKKERDSIQGVITRLVRGEYFTVVDDSKGILRLTQDDPVLPWDAYWANRRRQRTRTIKGQLTKVVRELDAITEAASALRLKRRRLSAQLSYHRQRAAEPAHP